MTNKLDTYREKESHKYEARTSPAYLFTNASSGELREQFIICAERIVAVTSDGFVTMEQAWEWARLRKIMCPPAPSQSTNTSPSTSHCIRAASQFVCAKALRTYTGLSKSCGQQLMPSIRDIHDKRELFVHSQGHLTREAHFADSHRCCRALMFMLDVLV